MAIKNKFFVIDVESMGLHGEGFAVGYVIVDREGLEYDAGYLYCYPDLLLATKDDCSWAIANTIPVMEHCVGDVVNQHVTNYASLCYRFWRIWSRHESECYLAADCPFPVEYKFIRDCIEYSEVTAEAALPYPFIDIASVILAAGFDPIATFPRLPDELPVHHALADARQSARVLINCLRETPATHPQGLEHDPV